MYQFNEIIHYVCNRNVLQRDSEICFSIFVLKKCRVGVSSFNNNGYHNQTSLFKYFWCLKETNKTPTVKWKLILKKSRICRSLNDPCPLCLHEKLYIIKFLKNEDSIK